MKDTSVAILSDITTFMKYAKYVPEIGRRETWEELCQRNIAMHVRKYPQIKSEIQRVYRDFVMPKKVLPSMRSLQFGGRPIELSPSRVFNCAFMPAEHTDSMAETMFLLLGGTGVGYSVQKHHVAKLPRLQGPDRENTRRYLVGDSIEGWADAIKIIIESYFYGKPFPRFDFNDIRSKGAMLVTSGGKAPGPQPLADCVQNIIRVLDQALHERGEFTSLMPIEVHDIKCYIADAVLAGGIRRAAMISLFSVDDEDMMGCKSDLVCTILNMEPVADEPGMFLCEVLNRTRVQEVKLHESEVEAWRKSGKLMWYYLEPQRGRSNNSAVLERGQITEEQFKDLWRQVEASGSGEPGVYWTNNRDWGTNPCVEIGLRPYCFCNLTDINADDCYTQADLNARAQAGAFIGTLQAGYTDFHYLRPEWKAATELDALIGVGMTGIGSGAVMGLNLTEAAQVVIAENQRVATLIGINAAARTTTVKPAGTTSLVVGSASGIHAWHNDFYMRRIRVAKNESIYRYLAEHHPDLVEDEHFRPHEQAVIGIPQRAPAGAILRHESPSDLLERVRKFNLEWVRAGHLNGENTHNVSVTISVKADEWSLVGNWMWENRELYNGISALPYDGGTYIQAPFEDITQEEYESLIGTLSNVDLARIIEMEDNTDLRGEVACGAGGCEVK